MLVPFGAASIAPVRQVWPSPAGNNVPLVRPASSIRARSALGVLDAG